MLYLFMVNMCLLFFFYAFCLSHIFFFFFFNDTATTEIYTLSLHDALPIWISGLFHREVRQRTMCCRSALPTFTLLSDRKSTRLNSSHSQISYAVFCLKKKKKKRRNQNHL